MQYIQSAMDAGIQVLGFSEHIPYLEIRLANCRMFYEHKEEYLSTKRKLKKTYEGKMDILVGYEIEYMVEHLDYLMNMRKECDYMILGQHCQFVDGGGYDYLSDDEAVMTYTKQVIEGMRSGLISMLAHPDYFMLGRRDFSTVCRRCAEEICACAVECNIPLEINLNGMRYGNFSYQEGERYPYPYREFWEIAANYPVQVLYGFDAHQPVTLLEDARIDKVDHILTGLSFSFVDTFVIK